MELVHSHIAKIPVSPCNKNTSIPKAVSDIVMKLLSKTAEDRYQTALGIQADLERCLQFVEESNYVPNFTIGQQDFSTQLLIPQKLYGREQEVAILIQAFERVSQGTTELMLVGGYSGIGKSSLVSSIHKPIVKQNGYFIAGKFDQFQRDVPYVSLIQAFRGLVQQILTQSHDKIEHWRLKLLQAFGNNGQVVIDVIPEVELIIGKQPPIPVLGANESQYRFNRVFKEFVRVFATHQHPLVIFLDDLQWADVASLNLINSIVTDISIQYLLVIGAYRDNEVNPAHPFTLTIDDIRSHNGTINTIILKSLELTHVNELLSETFNCSPEKSLSLAELCLSKTDANPFFLTQLLKSLFYSELVKFNLSTYEWEWDIKEITNAAITDNVVELMVARISDLSVQAEEKLIASFGFFTITEYNFYYSLSLAAIYSTASTTEKEEIITKLSSNQEKMKLWADNCPDNYLHKYLLVKAEIARITNNYLEAIHLYDDAIEAAQASEYIQNLAIANELAAKFYLEMGKVKLARPYFVDAHYYYVRWGALSKVQDLEARYSEFITTAPTNQPTILSTTNSITTNCGDSDFLDLASIIKASQTLASEIVKDKFLDKLIKIVIQNTGTDYGVLITVEDDKLFIEAAGFAKKDEVLIERVPFNQTSLQAPSKIINYVQLTKSSIVLANATQEELYAEDDYIQKNKPLSVLCTSILHQGKLVGIIYARK